MEFEEYEFHIFLSQRLPVDIPMDFSEYHNELNYLHLTEGSFIVERSKGK
ncbi:hypothetical protein [Fonticella tunisiensis]|nr:hypothetical protein [Fonticella tunisiensis]